MGRGTFGEPAGRLGRPGRSGGSDLAAAYHLRSGKELYDFGHVGSRCTAHAAWLDERSSPKHLTAQGLRSSENGDRGEHFGFGLCGTYGCPRIRWDSLE